MAVVLPALTADASDESEEFARKGLYLGLGAAYADPRNWNADVDNDLNEQAALLALVSARVSAAAIDPMLEPVEIFPVVAGARLEDPFPAFDVLIGYRAHRHFALEVEGEVLFGSNESDLRVSGSTGRHFIEVEDLWTVTANVKAFPLTGRIQPFGLLGLGLHHSEFAATVVTAGVTTTANTQMQTFVLPADFTIVERDEELDGAVRAGIGVDLYATRQLVLELKADYVHPFDEVGILVTDYFSYRGTLLFRF